MVGRLLKFFTVPLLTTGALTHDFMKNKTKRDDEFFGVVRVSPSNFITIARSINALNAKFNWTRFVMLYKPDGQQEVSGEGTCKLMMETLVESFKAITTKMVYRAVNMDRLNDTKKILLEEIGVDYSENFFLNENPWFEALLEKAGSATFDYFWSMIASALKKTIIPLEIRNDVFVFMLIRVGREPERP